MGAKRSRDATFVAAAVRSVEELLRELREKHNRRECMQGSRGLLRGARGVLQLLLLVQHL